MCIYLTICTKDFYFIGSTINFHVIQYRCFTNVGKNISITSSCRITEQTFERKHYNNSNSSCWLMQRSRFIPSLTGTGSLEWQTGKTWWVKQVRWRLAREGGGGRGQRSSPRGIARIFPEVRTIFQIPHPLNSKFDRQKHLHWHNSLCLRHTFWVYHPTFRCGKNSPLIQGKYSKESKRVKRNWGNLYCRCCCCFNVYTFFF